MPKINRKRVNNSIEKARRTKKEIYPHLDNPASAARWFSGYLTTLLDATIYSKLFHCPITYRQLFKPATMRYGQFIF